VRVKSPLVGEAAVGQPGDHMAGERAFAHIGQRFVIDDVIATTGTRQAMAAIEQADHLALLKMWMPSVRNSVTSRGAVVWS
jgi:hypothetical protein